MRKLHLIIAFACMGWTVKAQDSLRTVQLDEVVVTGTKSEIPVEKSGKSIFKLTRKDIESSGAQTVADLLNEVPGVQMDGNFGPMGTNIGYFIRGASSKRTLVLIDGVPFNDPSGIDQTYDFRLLDLDQVESIEILKGGLSTLYGTGAAAGVINVTLKKAERDGIGGTAGMTYGSFNTINPNLNVSGSQGKLNFMVNAGYRKSDGFSAATDPSGSGNFDDDGFEGYNFLGKIGYDFTEDFSLTFTGSLDDFEADYDQSEFTDANNTTEYQQLRFGLSPKFKIGNTSIKGDVFFSKLDRLFLSPESTFLPRDEYDAENIQVDFVADHNLTENIKLIAGLNYQDLKYSQPSLDEEGFYMIDPYLTFIYDEPGYTFQIGGRLNHHSEYGSNLVFNLSQSKSLFSEDNLRLIASYSTSFITPSLFQLFGPFGANTELEPEESKSAEGGLAFTRGVFQLEGVYFHRLDENLIVYSSLFEYENADQEIKTDGLEFTGSVQVSTNINLSANYAFVRRLDDAKLYRIPSHKYGASLNYQPLDGLNIGLNYLHTGDRTQQYYNPAIFDTDEAELDAFDLVDLSASYVFGNLTFSGNINNLLDENYQAIYGFNSVKRNYRIGVKYSF